VSWNNGFAVGSRTSLRIARCIADNEFSTNFRPVRLIGGHRANVTQPTSLSRPPDLSSYESTIPRLSFRTPARRSSFTHGAAHLLAGEHANLTRGR
jgi:hypothetical protein